MINDSLLLKEFMEKGRVESCPIIDMHGHYGPHNGIYFPSPLAEGMLHSMDRCGVTKLAFSSHAALQEPVRGNAVTESVVLKHPHRFVGYWLINPNYPDVIKRDLETFPAKKGFAGFKFLSDYHRYPITGEAYRSAMEYADTHHRLVLMHTWGHSPYDGPALVGRVAEKYPGAIILMGHSGYGEWETTIEVARRCPNVYLDLCADGSLAGIIDMLVGEVGSHRITFGTDLPWFDPHFLTGCILCAHISDEDRRNIFYRNAEKLLAGVGC